MGAYPDGSDCSGLFSSWPCSLGSCLLPPNRSQLPAGSGRVFPGHLQQQDLPQCCFVRRPRNLPGELVFPTLLSLTPASSVTCLLSCTFRGCLTQWFCPAQTWQGFCLVPAPSSVVSFPFHVREGRKGQGQGKRKNNKAVFSFLTVDFLTVGFCLEAVGPIALKTNALTCVWIHVPHSGSLAGLGSLEQEFSIGILDSTPPSAGSTCTGPPRAHLSCLGFISLPRAPLG